MNINKQQNLPHSQAVVLPMRFYANWDVDRTSSPIAVQRNLSMVFTRLMLTKTLVETENTPITIAVRLQNSRRILRSNDLPISPSRLDTQLDISFTIQYCHFIKRKQNILQILIQRRKRYKNRQIPGFKTLAMGHLNLDEILQFGGSREVVIWDTNCLRQKARHSMRELHAGKIFIANCYTQAADSTDVYTGVPSNSRHQRLVAAINEKEPVMSEEEQEEFSSVDDSESENDYTPRGATNNHPIAFIQRRQKKFLKQRNIKQRVIALLRKFKPDEEAANSECPHTSRSIVDPPTEQELQEIFEELGNISDSGPELEPDKLSIISNPRPKIRPFFGSKSDIMPPIEDFQNEEGLFLSDEITDDSEIQSSGEEHQQKQEEIESNRKESGNSLGATAKPTNYVRPLLVHSETVNSITLNEQRQRMLDPVEELLSKSEHLGANQIIPEHLWICSSADLNWIAKINPKMVEPLILLDCPSSTIIRSLLQTIIAKIQNFCNNNSISPPTTTIGVLGGDHLLANILKAYVHLLQDKACKEDWLNYLRFSLVLPPNCAIGRLLSQVAGFGGYSEAIWKVLSRVSKSFTAEGGKTGNAGVVEHNEIRNCLVSLTRGQSGQRCTNLQIGEVMLSGPSTRVDPEGKSQVFVPFLAELLTGSNVGNEQQSSSFDPSFSSLYFIRQNTIGVEDRNAECPIEVSAPAIASSQNQATSTSRGYPTQHSQSSPSIPALTIGEIKDMTEEDFTEKGNTSPPRHVAGPSAKNSPAQPNESSRELQIEYWTVLSYPCNSTPNQHVQQREDAGTTSNVGSKFSMKASVRTLSIAREPMSNLLSILFVKERKKDKVLQKLGRKSKQKSIDTGAGFCPQSRVVSGVTRIVCTSGSGIGGGKKDAAMDLTIDGVLWRQVRFFQIGAQWQTHVKLFPVSFPMELPVAMPM